MRIARDFFGRVVNRRILTGLLAIIFMTFLFGKTVLAPSVNIDSAKLSVHKPRTKPTTSLATSLSPDKVIKNTPQKTPAPPVLTVLPPIHPLLASSSNPQLRKLAQYEQALGGSNISRMMIFTDIPANAQQAQSDAADMAGTLKEFARCGVQALVVMEPTINSSPVSFQSYHAGAYDAVLDTYFSTLKAQGISDAAMGMWVYFPEANLPEWGAVDTADFAANVVRTVNLQKKYFPASQASIMLDAESYPTNDTSWDNGSYISLAPFISGIPKGLLDGFGLQGFPWTPNSGGPDASYNPAQYLNASWAIQAAQQLGTNSVWFNTGTFAQSGGGAVTMSPAQRQSILNGVIQQAQAVKNADLGISINLFAEDKSNDSEAIDWSYWKAGSAATSTSTAVFVSFADQLFAQQIGLWLFDSL